MATGAFLGVATRGLLRRGSCRKDGAARAVKVHRGQASGQSQDAGVGVPSSQI